MRTKKEQNQWNFYRKKVPLIQEKARWIMKHRVTDEKWCQSQLEKFEKLESCPSPTPPAKDVLAIVAEPDIYLVKIQTYQDMNSDVCKKLMRIRCILKFESQ